MRSSEQCPTPSCKPRTLGRSTSMAGSPSGSRRTRGQEPWSTSCPRCTTTRARCVARSSAASAWCPVAEIHGSCQPAFASVREEFRRNFTERGELGASLHITVDGEAVVDLWGGTADPVTGRPWEADTLAVVYSCTKGIVALAAHMLVDRGLLDLEGLVSDYWPEYGCNGKEATTVRML